ncbi:hypothetical protein WOLCODRAFT_18015 [Wolfiporia cocos MD-104 SS10]|uniref:BTB domain-containing protein n=1 Tax=Wolfiporia cocos (strain MD-104) TaxID=742152 RepID=A0A2H3JLY1_WOLCO|nr:hypothetical protein WOLCODRAFT_18015 [Wolfiporia cocos MD-104 SS10]
MVSSFFNNSNDADVVLRTCDDVDFFVHKLVLRLASPVFGDMFRIPQPSDSDTQARCPGSGLPLIRVSESSIIFETLLRFCYPGIANPKLKPRTPSEIGRLLEAAIKYEIDYFTSELKSSLTAMMQQHPVAVYAIACRLNLEREARLAAEKTLFDNGMEYGPDSEPEYDSDSELEYDSDSELDKVSAGILYRLLKYRHLRHSGANIDASYTFCCPTSFSSQLPAGSDSPQANLPWPPTDLPGASIPPDIFLQSSDLVIHPAHTSMLRMTSTILDQPQLGQENSSPLTVTMSEDSQILRILLHLCYPCDDPMVDDLDIASRLLNAAKKSRISRAVRFSKKIWTSHLDSNPLRVFLAAKIFGWDEVASEAAKHTVFSYDSLDPYYPEMEHIPASAYRRLLDFRQSCHVILIRMVKEMLDIEDTTPHWRKAGDRCSWDKGSKFSIFACSFRTPQDSSQKASQITLVLPYILRGIDDRGRTPLMKRSRGRQFEATMELWHDWSDSFRTRLFAEFSKVEDETRCRPKTRRVAGQILERHA